MITVQGEILAASWSVALYQYERQYVVAEHRDGECTQVISARVVSEDQAKKIREELIESQHDRHAPWPVIVELLGS